jgi:transketolase
LADPTPPRRPFDEVDSQAIAAIRGLAIDAVERANSGHPGLPMGAAPMAWALWSRHLKACPTDPGWPDRDRFVLSAGHGSMLLYALLHLAGYPVSLDDLRDFRQWESRTPGHPETFATPGVEATTGPLGQGAGNSVGMAIAERALRAQFPGLVDHRTFALVSDGDLMEGVACEAASLAGQLGLGRLVWLYDRNDVTLDGPASLSFSVEDVAARHQALGWHVQSVSDGDHDLDGIDAAITAAVADAERPSLIVVNTTIGYGAPNKAGSSSAHGVPLGTGEAAAAKAALGLDPGKVFAVPDAVRERCAARVRRGEAAREAWSGTVEQARSETPERVAALERRLGNELPAGWDETLPTFGSDDRLATRDASGKAMNALAARVPEFFGGDADLSCSTKTALVGLGSQSAVDAVGRNLHYGVREHAMGAAANGIAYHGGFRTFASTFFCFADYMRPSIRLAALSGLPVVYVWTHDSVGVGEDGPTHQPVEHLMSLRAMPNLHVLRPADANETVEAWRHALLRTEGPTALVLTRQKVPTLTTPETAAGLRRGGYVLRNPESGLRAVLIATGSEVPLATAAAEQLDGEGVGVRVVSLPCWELFEAQDAAYRESVLPAGLPRVAVEAGATLGWERYVGSGPVVGVDRFGASAPGPEVAARLGLTEDAVRAAVRSVVGTSK